MVDPSRILSPSDSAWRVTRVAVAVGAVRRPHVLQHHLGAVLDHARVIARDAVVEQPEVGLVAAADDQLLLVELVHLAHVGPRHHDQVGVFVASPVGAGACDVRVVSSSGSPTRSDAILVFYRPARRPGNFRYARHDGHQRVFLCRVARQLLSRRSCPRPRCSRSTRASWARSRSTTPSTGCRRASLLERWAAATPGAFRFALKSPRGITHMRRLADVGRRGRAAGGPGGARSASAWGRSCSSCRRTCARTWACLEAFLATLPAGLRAAVEFRHESWLADDVYAVLRAPRRRAVHRRVGGIRDAARGDRGLGLPAAPPPGLRQGRAPPLGQAAAGAELRRPRTCSSSTRTRARGPALADSFRSMMI